MPITPLNRLFRTPATTSRTSSEQAPVPPYATPLRETPAPRRRTGGLMGLLPGRRRRADANASGSADPGATPPRDTAAAAPRTAPGGPLHSGTVIDPLDPHRAGAALYRALSQWQAEMQARLREYTRTSQINGMGSPQQQLAQAVEALRAAGAGRTASLVLMAAPLMRLPDELCDFAHLRELQVVDCDVRQLPEALGNLHQLRTLSINHNPRLSSVPRSIGELSHLRQLTISYSNVHALPPLRGLQQLRGLVIRSAPLSTLPPDLSSLPNLQALSVERTRVRQLPSNLGSLRNLTALSLSRNENLEALPQSIGNLVRLERLDLTGCTALRRLPESLGNLPRLTHLDLSDCHQLESLPASLRNPRPELRIIYPPHLRPAAAPTAGAASSSRAGGLAARPAAPPQLPREWQRQLAPHMGDPRMSTLVDWLAKQADQPDRDMQARLAAIVAAMSGSTADATSLRHRLLDHVATSPRASLGGVEDLYVVHQIRTGKIDPETAREIGLQRAHRSLRNGGSAAIHTSLKTWAGMHVFAARHDPIAMVAEARLARAMEVHDRAVMMTNVLQEIDYKATLETIGRMQKKELPEIHSRIARQWMHPDIAQAGATAAAQALPDIERALESNPDEFLAAIEGDPIIMRINRDVRHSLAELKAGGDPAAIAAAETGQLLALAQQYQRVAKEVVAAAQLAGPPSTSAG